MCSLIDILQWKKIQKDSDDFWHRKLTLKVKFWYFLTAPHYSNFQNLVISFEYSWFLAKNLSNFVSLPWKLHNQECHKVHTCKSRTGALPICKFETNNSTRRTILFSHSCHVCGNNTVPLIIVKINSNSEGKVASWNMKRMKMNK